MTMQISSIFEPKTRSVFIKSTKIPATNKDAFEYHAREGALERLVPPWSILTVTSHEGISEMGPYPPSRSAWGLLASNGRLHISAIYKIGSFKTRW